MPQYGMTVTPDIYVDEFGQEQVDYANAYVDDRSGRMHAIEQHNHEQDGYIKEYSDGTRIHETGRLDPEVYQQYEDDWVEEETSEDYFEDADITPQDLDYLQEQVGGTRQYSEMTRWAYHNLDPDWIDWYDETMESSDIEAMQEAIQELAGYYHQRDVDEDSYDNTDYELESAAYNYVGGEGNYQELVSWAADNMSEQFIDAYDEVMNDGNPYEIQQAIDSLISHYQEYN